MLDSLLAFSVIKTLEVTVMKNLKVNVMTQIFKKNFSTSDAFFYTNQITTHVSFFYSSLTNFEFFAPGYRIFLYLLFSNPTMVSAFAAGVLLLIIPIKKLLVNSKTLCIKLIYLKKVERRNSESNRKSIFN